MLSIYAIITARGGSKGIPRKNIRMLSGKPLIAHTILAALRCDKIERCIVSTEDEEIKQISVTWGAEVIDRPVELAGDTILSRDVVKAVLDTLAFQKTLPDYFVLLQPTSPLRTTKHITECIELLLHSKQGKCAVSVTEAEHHPYKSCFIVDGQLQPAYDYSSLEVPRQLLPGAYRPNGAIYLMKSADFLEKCTFFMPPCIPYIMSAQDSVDIDSEIDFLLAEKWMRANSRAEG